MRCNRKTEVYSRVVGYYRPIQQWNRGKKEEYGNRVTFNLSTGIHSKTAQIARAKEKEEASVVEINLTPAG